MKEYLERVRKLPFRRKVAAIALMGAVIIGVGLLISVNTVAPNPQEGGESPRQESYTSAAPARPLPDEEFKVYSGPRGKLDSPSAPLVFTFSQSAEAHHLEEFFSIMPKVEGKFHQRGLASNEISFVPATPYVEGVTYTVKVKSGFYSSSGKKLREDYVAKIALQYDDKTFALTKDGDASYFFGVSDDTVLTFQVGNFVEKTSIKIYTTGNPEQVLKSFVHKQGSGYWQGGTVVVPKHELTLVSEDDTVAQGDTLSLPARPGMYFIELLKAGQPSGWSWVVKSSAGVHFRQDDQGFLIALQDLKTGAPLGEQAAVSVYQMQEAVKKVKELRLANLEYTPFPFPQRIDALAVTVKGETMIVPVSVLGSMAEVNVWRNLNEQRLIFVYKDKPLYKPGDTLYFRGLVREDRDAQYRLPAQGEGVRLQFPREEVVVAETGKRGEFFGKWKIPADLQASQYYVSVLMGQDNENYENKSSGYLNFEVVNYQKPEFDLTLNASAAEYTKGDKVELRVEGFRFDGKPFASEAVRVSIYAQDYYETEKAVYSKAFRLNNWGGMCGGGFGGEYYGEPVFEDKELMLDAAGKALFTFDTGELQKLYSQNLTFIVEKDDQKGNTITTGKSVIVHSGEMNIFIRRTSARTLQGLARKIFFNAEYQDGGKLAGENFYYTISAVQYSSASRRSEVLLDIGTVATDVRGIGEIPLADALRAPEGYDRLKLVVLKHDRRGNLVKDEMETYDYREEETVLKVTSPSNNVKAGSRAQMLVEAPEDMTVLLAYERGRVYEPKFLTLKKGENNIEFLVQDEFIPSITPTFSFFYNNHYYVEGLSFNVPAMQKVITVDATSDKNQYKSGEKARVKVRLTDYAGRPVKGEFSLGVVDKAVYALRKGSIPAMHSSFYYYRPRQTNNSSSMTYVTTGYGAEKGGGGEGASSMGLRDSDLLYWNPFIETNENGEAEVEFPMLGNTIYQAVIFAATDRTELGQGEFDLTARE